ncbi:ABC transporter permease [Xylanimonas protaetiae]|uniref:ABC transporter permease n=1 Tax=Xylanimonas protaetiae TaxID=2509457 RepID=A0A4P6F613_9MICO|nr:ABC transporter permease [Xylanimonas protaetiae]QAY71400.1 ABC transporter permease [Xylanimonas protaetiae]
MTSSTVIEPAATPADPPDGRARHAAPGTAPSRRTTIATYVGMLLFPFVMVTMMYSTYVGTMHAPQVRDLPVAVVGTSAPGSTATQAVNALDAVPDSQLDPRLVPDVAAARDLLQSQDVAAVVVPPATGDDHATVLIASAGGASKTQTVQTLVVPTAAGLGWSTQVEDVAPLPAGDSSGTVVMFAAMGMMLAGYVPLSIMMMGTPHLLRLRRFLPVLAGWAVVVPTVIWLLLGPLVGGVQGHYLTFLGVGALTVSAVGLVQLFFAKVAGPLAVLLGMLLLVVFGMPASNLALPVQSMPGFFQALHHVLPLPAAGEALRSILYFDGVGLWPHLVTLAVGLVVGLVAATLVERKNGDAIPAASKFTDSRTPLPALPGGPVRSRGTRHFAAAAFPGTMLVLVVGLMGFSMHAPTVHDLPVAVVGPTQEAAEQTVSALAGGLGDVVDLQVMASADDADAAIKSREIVAAFLLPGATDASAPVLHTASGAGMAQQRAVSAIFTQVTAAQGVSLDQVDIVPLTDQDTQGSNTLYVAMAWVMAGFLVCAVLRGGAPTLRTMHQQLPLLLAWAVVMSTWLWLLFAHLIGAVHGPAWQLIGVGALTIFSVSMATSVVTRSIGMAAVPAVTVVMLLAGVPASGGGLSIYMVPEFFQRLHSVLPLGGAVDAVRSITYFDGIGLVPALFVILAWGAAGLLVNVVLDKHLVKRPVNVPPERFMPRGAAA